MKFQLATFGLIFEERRNTGQEDEISYPLSYYTENEVPSLLTNNPVLFPPINLLSL